MTKWYETEAGRARLEHDRRIVAELQPELRYEEKDGALHLVGDVVFRTESGIPERIPSQIDFPADYPQGEPVARDIANRFPQHDADHHFIGDKLCLWVGIETRYRPDDPDGLRKVIDEVVVFLVRQLVWENEPERGYPGPARPHGLGASYAQIAGEALRMHEAASARMWRAIAGNVSRKTWCPCGRRRRYLNCHRDLVERFRARHSADEILLIAEVLRHQALRLPFPQKGAAA